MKLQLPLKTGYFYLYLGINASVIRLLFAPYTSFILPLSKNIQVLLWGKEESELDRLQSRLSQLYYDNLLTVRAHLYSSCLSYNVYL